MSFIFTDILVNFYFLVSKLYQRNYVVYSPVNYYSIYSYVCEVDGLTVFINNYEILTTFYQCLPFGSFLKFVPFLFIKKSVRHIFFKGLRWFVDIDSVWLYMLKHLKQIIIVPLITRHWSILLIKGEISVLGYRKIWVCS